MRACLAVTSAPMHVNIAGASRIVRARPCAGTAKVTLSTASFIYGNMYDMSRPVNISIGIFGPNLPV